MKKLNWWLTAICVLSLLGGNAFAQQKLWVSSSGAKLKADPKALSKTVSEVAEGTELSVLEADDKWYRVSAPDGSEGWIYRGKVADAPPAAGSGGGGGGLFGSVASSRIEAGAADTSRSIRGLSPETEAYANAAGSSGEARRALDDLLAVKITDQEVELFLQQGRIGEYAP